MRPKDFPVLILFAIGVVVLIGLGLQHPLAAEGGLIENLQVAILLFSVGIFANWIMHLARAPQRNDTSAMLSYLLFLMCLPVTGVGRELSFGRVFGFESVIVIEVLSGIVVGGLLVASLLVWVRRVRRRFITLLWLFRSKTSLVLYIAVGVFFVGAAFEDGSFGLPHSELMEEIIETLAFMLVGYAAFVAGEDVPYLHASQT